MIPRGPIPVAIALALLTPGCSYDWSVPPGPAADAGDAGDATVADSSAPDAASDVESSEASSIDSGPSCSDLLADISSAESSAKLGCSAGTPCTSTVKDQCGCPFFVGQASSTATSDLVSAVAAFDGGHCAAACGTCPAPVSSVQCLDMAAGDGGIVTSCQEP